MFVYQCPAVVMTALLLCVGQAGAATLAPFALTPLRPLASGPSLDEIVRTDPLGYECVPEDRLEDAFQAGAKGPRLPRTCLPEPCKEALGREELASVVGFRPDDTLWDDYVTRYAQYCRHEALWPDEDSAAEDASPQTEITGTSSFWAPLVARGAGLAVLRQSGGDLSSGSGRILSGSSGGGAGATLFTFSSFSGARGSESVASVSLGTDTSADGGSSSGPSGTSTGNGAGGKAGTPGGPAGPGGSGGSKPGAPGGRPGGSGGGSPGKDGPKQAGPAWDETADQPPISFLPPDQNTDQGKPVFPQLQADFDVPPQITVVPLPAGLALLVAALGVLIPVGRRRRA